MSPARHAFRAALATLFLGGFAPCFSPGANARAEVRQIEARVVWAGNAHVYLAVAPAAALENGDLLFFLERGRKLATAEVTQIIAGEMVAARLASGSLRAVRRLDRVRVMCERRPPRSSLSLRIGYPAGARENLLFACDSMRRAADGIASGYRVTSSSRRWWSLARDSTTGAAAPWPDTLLIRLFDDEADEEIALERGEIDAGVFWPGELSSHMRESARWRDAPVATWTSRVLVAHWDTVPGVAEAPVSDRARLLALCREVFHGDLALLGADSAGVTPAALLDGPASRFEVDAGIPGRAAIERFLNRPARTVAPSATEATVRISWRVDALSSVEAEDFQGFRYVLNARCPVVCAPEKRAIVIALGAGNIVQLTGCAAAERRP